MKYLEKMSWYVSSLIVGFLLLRMFIGVSHFDFNGYGSMIYVLLIIGYVFYTKLYSERNNLKWYKLLVLSLVLILAVFLFFFVVFDLNGV